MRLAPLSAAIATCAALSACAPYADPYGYAYSGPAYATPAYGYAAPVEPAPAYGYGYGGYVGGPAVVGVPVPSYGRDRVWVDDRRPDRGWNDGRRFERERPAFAEPRRSDGPRVWAGGGGGGGGGGGRPAPVAAPPPRPAPPVGAPQGGASAEWARQHINGAPSLNDAGGANR